MQVNERVRKELIKGLIDRKGQLVEDFEARIKAIEEAESVEMIMYHKKYLLFDLLYGLPLGSDECYFCLLIDRDCLKCLYAEAHGACGHEISNDYDVIVELRRTLFNKLNEFGYALESLIEGMDLYYKGESYDEDQAS